MGKYSAYRRGRSFGPTQKCLMRLARYGTQIPTRKVSRSCLGELPMMARVFSLLLVRIQLVQVCPGENVTYIDCVRDNIEDRSTAAQATYQFGSQVRTTSSPTGHTKSDTGRQPVVQTIKELITQLPFEETQDAAIRISSLATLRLRQRRNWGTSRK